MLKLKSIGLGIAALLLSASVFAAENTTTSTAPAMTAEQEKMMKAWEEAGRLMDQHKAMAYLVGDWNAKTKFWQMPNSKPEETTGKAHFESVLGGRYIRETFEGMFMGKPFQGLSYMGYDNMKKKYTSTWMDSMSTKTFVMEGDSTDNGKTIKSGGEFYCEVEGKQKKMRSVMKKVNNNEVRYEHFDVGPDGKEFKSLEIVYKRAAS